MTNVMITNARTMMQARITQAIAAALTFDLLENGNANSSGKWFLE
jgi:hypothetical protein